MFRNVCRGNVRFTSFHRFCSSSPQSTESLTYKLSKILSLQGVCSRREAEKLIESGKVKVNNKVVNNIGTRLVPFGCNITVQEKPVRNKTSNTTPPQIIYFFFSSYHHFTLMNGNPNFG